MSERTEVQPSDMSPEEIDEIVARMERMRKSSRTVLDILEGKHTLNIIAYMDSASPVMKTDIYNNVSRSGNMLNKIRDLEELGLIRVYETGNSRAQVVAITKKGRDVAQLLHMIEEEIERDRCRGRGLPVPSVSSGAPSM